MMMAIALFIAGSLIFVIMELFQLIAESGDYIAAFLVVIPAIFLISCAFLAIVKKMFFTVWNEKREKERKLYLAKILLSFVAFQVTKFFLFNRKKKT